MFFDYENGENDSSNNSYSSYYQTLKSIYEIYNYIAVLNVIKRKCMPKKNRTLVLELRIPRSPTKKKINLVKNACKLYPMSFIRILG